MTKELNAFIERVNLREARIAALRYGAFDRHDKGGMTKLLRLYHAFVNAARIVGYTDSVAACAAYGVLHLDEIEVA